MKIDDKIFASEATIIEGDIYEDFINSKLCSITCSAIIILGPNRQHIISALIFLFSVGIAYGKKLAEVQQLSDLHEK